MSPKNKGKFGPGKSAVELDDEFVSGVSTVAEKLKPYTKILIAVPTALFLGLAAWYAYRHLDERSEAKATALYRQALDIAERPVVPPDPAEEGKDKDAEPGAEGKPEAKTEAKTEAKDDAEDEATAGEDAAPENFPSHQAQAEAVLVPLETLRKEYGSSDTARAARLFYASTLYAAGRYQDAIAVYQDVLANPVTPDLASEAREGLGYAQEALALASEDQAARQTALEQALATFGEIQSKEDGPQREVALYHQARILATLGKREEAVAALKKAMEVAPDSPLRNDIRQRLALLSE